MRKLLILLIVLLPLLILTPNVNAQFESPLGNKFGNELVTLEEDEIIEDDYFAAGETVEVYGTIEGDAYIAGGSITINGTIKGDLLVAGGNVVIGGEVGQDVRIIGGDISISADVARNITAVGGNIKLTDSASVAGSLIGAGGSFVVNAPVAGSINVASGDLTLSNSVGGNVESGVEQLQLTSQADIGGDLIYYSEEEALIAETASVSGQIQRNNPRESFAGTDRAERGIRSFVDTLQSTFSTVGLISIAIVGLITLKLFPRYTNKVVTNLALSPWKNIALGFLLLIVTPIAIVLAIFTLVGIPIALMILALYLIAIYVSKVFAIHWVGIYLNGKIDKRLNVYVSFILGLIAYTVLGMIPIAGGLIKFIVLLISLGAMATTCRQTYSEAIKQKVV